MNTITFGVKNSLYIFGGYIKMQSKAFYLDPKDACFSHKLYPLHSQQPQKEVNSFQHQP